MHKQKLISLPEAAALIPDGAVVTVSSSSGLGCPDAVLAAIGQRLPQIPLMPFVKLIGRDLFLFIFFEMGQ